MRLSKHFGGIVSLNEISLNFSEAQLVAIAGPNGAGKTTLFNTWTGYITADTGKTHVFGQESTNLSPDKIARLGIARTFQQMNLISKLSVREHIMLALPDQLGESVIGTFRRKLLRAQESKGREIAHKWLQFVELAEHETELAGALSYGQQKLLALACVLATGANILLLDEPVAGVHPSQCEHIGLLIQKLKAEGMLIVFIEHNLAFVQAVAERLIVMEGGCVISDGNPRTVLNRPEVMRAFTGFTGKHSPQNGLQK